MRKLNGLALRRYKKELRLSSEQKELIIGSLLGDGNMRFSWSCPEANFIVDHSADQKEYVYWKYKILKEWCLKKPIQTQRTYHKNPNHKLESFRFFTISHPEFTKLYKLFYRDGRKRIPLNIKEILTSAFSLAIWVMDDGSRNKKALFLNTQGFPVNEQKILQECLKTNFDLDSTINVHSFYKGRKYYRIRLTTESTAYLFGLIQGFLLPSMRYKFPLYPRND